jgi:hypothetical protein
MMVSEISYDVKNLYNLFTPEALFKSGTTDKKNTLSEDESKDLNINAWVFRGPFPVQYSGTPVGLLWIAFVCGDYVSQQQTNRIPDLLSGSADEKIISWCLDFNHLLLKDSPNPLISTGAFVFNKKYFSKDLLDYQDIMERSGDAPLIKEELEMLEDLPPKEALRAAYSLTDSTLVNGYTIPTHFSEHSRFELGSPFSIGENSGHKTTAIVTNIVVGQAPVAMLPQFDGKFYVIDYRFIARTKEARRGPVFYHCTNEWEIATNSAKLLSAGSTAWSHHISQASEASDSFSKRKLVFLAILILPIPILCIWYYRGRRES